MESVNALPMALQALVLLSGTLVATYLVWYVVGRRDRAVIRKRHPGARGTWICGWVGVLPYMILSLAQLSAELVGSCAMAGIAIVGASHQREPAQARWSQEDFGQIEVVTLTPAAGAAVRIMMGDDELLLRVRVEQDGDGSLGYALEFTHQADPTEDYLMMSQGVRIVMDWEAALLLAGTVLDFQHDDAGGDFVFDNPNAPCH